MSGTAELSYWLKRQLSAFEEKFDNADKDKNGSLSYSEISEVLKNAGFKGTVDDMKAIFKFADTNKDSKISKSEYVNCVKKAPKISLQEIVLRRAFRKYDKDDSGFLTRDELMAITASEEAGLKLPAEKIADMLLALVTDADKKISYEEFLAHFRFNQTATLLLELFQRIDTDKSGALTKSEIIEAIKADEQLDFTAVNLSQLLIAFSKDRTDKLDYKEFARIVAAQALK